MKTLKQLHSEKIATLFLDAMSDIAEELQSTMNGIINEEIAFCKGRKLMQAKFNRLRIIDRRYNNLCKNYEISKEFIDRAREIDVVCDVPFRFFYGIK